MARTRLAYRRLVNVWTHSVMRLIGANADEVGVACWAGQARMASAISMGIAAGGWGVSRSIEWVSCSLPLETVTSAAVPVRSTRWYLHGVRPGERARERLAMSAEYLHRSCSTSAHHR